MKTHILFTLVLFLALIAGLEESLRAQQHEPSMVPVQTGSVSGKVEILKLGEPQHAARHHVYGIMNMTSRAPLGANEYANIVVSLEGQNLKRELQHTPPHSQIDQRNAEFIPHVLPVLRGTVVDFINRDNVYHNVFSLSAAKKFNIGRRPTGQAVPVLMDRPGIVEIFCDIHSNMSAYILVFENEYFTQPDKKGNYSIDHIPPGTYTIKAWHERLSSQEQSVTVLPNSTTTINFVME